MLIISETQFIYIQPTHQTISISIYLLKNIKLEWFLLLLLHWQKKAGLRMMDVHHWYSFYLDAQSCKIETGKATRDLVYVSVWGRRWGKWHSG